MEVERTGDLDDYPPIPDELSDARVELARTNPRAYVIDTCSLSHAQLFPDSEIAQEARRILEVSIRRWRGESVELFASPPAEVFAWAEGPTVEYVHEAPWWASVRKKHLPEFQAISKELGVKPPRILRTPTKLKFLWGRRYNWVAAVFYKAASPKLFVEHESKGKVSYSLTISGLREALFTMRSPWPTPGDCP